MTGAIDGCTILLASGRYVNPLDLQAGDVCIDDIAHALGNQCRYSGHTRHFYSVAQHSVLVADALRADSEAWGQDVLLWGLLHDAAEAYLVDLPRPLKHHPDFGALYRAAEARALMAIADHFGLPHVEPHIVKHYDLRLLATERRDLLPPNGDWAVLDGVKPLPGRITAWSPTTATGIFLKTFEVYLREIAA